MSTYPNGAPPRPSGLASVTLSWRSSALILGTLGRAHMNSDRGRSRRCSMLEKISRGPLMPNPIKLCSHRGTTESNDIAIRGLPAQGHASGYNQDMPTVLMGVDIHPGLQGCDLEIGVRVGLDELRASGGTVKGYGCLGPCLGGIPSVASIGYGGTRDLKHSPYLFQHRARTRVDQQTLARRAIRFGDTMRVDWDFIRTSTIEHSAEFLADTWHSRQGLHA